jgi:hypothetical protein
MRLIISIASCCCEQPHSSYDESGLELSEKVRVIDIIRFSKQHPAGDIILLSAGNKDATILFRNYHPRGVPKSLLGKLELGTLAVGDNVGSYYDWSSGFCPTLCYKRVTERLESLRGNSDIREKSKLS